jgi:glycosyltransferase involved in cell wall biosynthesis
MIKILFIVDGYPDNQNYANIFIKNQVTALKAAGFDIAVLIIDIRSFRHIRRFGFYKEVTTEMPTWRLSIPWGPLFLKTGQKLANFLCCRSFNKIQLDFGKPDILHAHFGEVGITGAEIKKIYHIPLVITEHGSIMLPGNSSIQRKLRVINEAYKNCDSLIAVGTNLAKHIKALGIEKISVIPNFIPDSFFNNSRQLNKKIKKQFISIGTLLPSKRYDLTISAFARICEVVEDISLVIIGTGPLLKSLQIMVHEKKIEDKVSFSGFVPNIKLPEIYKESVCFVLPSDYETFGVVYAEALACGIPVIATKCGGPEDIVNSKNGLLIPKNDEDALVEAMLYMYHNSTNYNSEFIIEDIYNRFGEKSVIQRIIDVYSEILGKHKTILETV